MSLNNIKNKKIFLLTSLSLLFVIITIVCELTAYNNLLPTISLVLILTILIANLYLNNNDYLSPLTVFSIMYSGYAIGGFYYSFSTNSFGRFIDFVSLPHSTVVSLMQYGLFYSLICYLLFVLGYSLFNRPYFFFAKQPSNFWIFFAKSYFYIVIPFLILGLLHWYRVAEQTAGSIYDLFIYFQVFPHLVEEAGLSTLPYHFYTAGIYLWLLGIIINKKKISLLFIFCSILGMLMIITQGRIILAVTYLIAQLVFFGLLDKSNRTKVFYMIGLLMFAAFIVFFLRILSNSLFIGSSLTLSDINIIESIIGGGNVADLQQLVIIFSTFDINNSLLGSTYLDWIRNTFGVFLDIPPSSVGLIIKDLYFPQADGAPTPGAIGEAYANFSIAAPFFMFFVGVFFALVSNRARSSGNVLLLLVYSIFLTRFVFMYPKVDSTMMSNFFWGAAPMLITIFLYFLFYKLIARRYYNNA